MSPAVVPTNADPGAARSHRSPATRSGLARRAFAVLGSAALIAGLAACTSKQNSDPSTWPDGAQVLAQASQAMGTLTSVHLRVDLDPAIATPPIRRADLDLTAIGDSQGDLESQPAGGAMTTFKYVALHPDADHPDGQSYVYLTGTGWISYKIASYDTASVLPNLAKEVGTATGAKTVGDESVAGTDAWKIDLTYETAVINTLLPGTTNADGSAGPPALDASLTLTGTVWIAKDTHYIVKSDVHIPASPTGVNPETSVTMTCSNFNVPVDIRAPNLG
jgi:hypothetical protein